MRNGRGRGPITAHLAWWLAAVAALAWLPFVAKPVSPDEGGFLLVAAQWQPGRSLYGHYWVDRPPMLITVFDLACSSPSSTWPPTWAVRSGCG